jgi:YesN/AraC family two-component response regulator
MATILVVDDELRILRMLRGFLEREGHMVLTAKDGEKALRICNTHEGKIDVMITDINMPGLDGMDLATQARASRPSLRVMFISGFMNHEDLIRKGFSSGDLKFIEKPFDLVTVDNTISAALASGQR